MIISYIKNESSFKIEYISEMETGAGCMENAEVYYEILKAHDHKVEKPEWPSRVKGECYDKDYGKKTEDKYLSLVKRIGVSDIEVSNGGKTVRLLP
ncbi:hypothetical protein ACMAZD_26160 (plasmid) [Vibrio sp. nBUS_14]|uniref:hypothetical protein n=1 Tax=Vibrio sp. nBUS_14 TaxID=3395321 RepID=UPI003EBFF858